MEVDILAILKFAQWVTSVILLPLGIWYFNKLNSLAKGLEDMRVNLAENYAKKEDVAEFTRLLETRMDTLQNSVTNRLDGISKQLTELAMKK